MAEGTVLGRYVLLEELGSGGMGVVYAALDPDLDRRIALKLLRTDKIRDPAARTRDQARLLREAQAMARLDHPNVVTVHDVGTIDGRVYIAMDYVEGETMGAWLSRGPHPVDATLAVLLPAAQGLAAAHEAGLIHRDFKPDNVLIDPMGGVHVLDFGLAIGATTDEVSGRSAAPGEAATSGMRRMTHPGQVMGTPAYMSPEQHRGRAVDGRSDQFSWCVTFWEALYGSRPFGGKNRSTIAFKVVRGELNDPPPDVEVPAHIHRALVRGLEADPQRRWPSMGALVEAITADPGARRRRGVVAGLAVVVIGGTVAVYVNTPTVEPTPVCTPPASPVDGVWSAADRGALINGGSRAPVATNAGVEHVDAWARAWGSIRLDACAATFEREDQSRTMFALQLDCLADRRAELDDALRLLVDGDVDPAFAHAVLSGLPAPHGCADRLALLEAKARRDGAHDPVSRRPLVVQLNRARLMQRAGQLETAIDQATAALASAENRGDALLVAQASWVLGDLLRRREGADEPAALALHRAAQIAIGRDHPRLAARAWTSSIWLALSSDDASALDEALELGHYAAAGLERIESEGELAALERGALLLAMGALLERRGELAAAEQHLSAAITAFDNAALTPLLARAHAQRRRAELAARRGDVKSAWNDLASAMHSMAGSGLPDDAPPMLEARLLQGDLALARGDAPAAAGIFADLLARPDGMSLRHRARALLGAGEAAMVTGAFEDAETQLERALASWRQLGADAETTARTRRALETLRARGREADNAVASPDAAPDPK